MIRFNPLIFGGFDLTGSGGGPAGAVQWKQPVNTEADLPMVGNAPGDARVAKDTDRIYVWDETTSKWIDTGLTTAAVGAAPNANGLTLSTADVTVGSAAITRRTINLQPADAANPGVVSTTTQTFAGSKTFLNQIQADGGVDVTATVGTDVLNIGTTNANTVNIGNNLASVNIDGTVNIDYTPADPADWAPAPTHVIEAIDQLADRFVERDTITKEPTGFPNRTDSVLSFTDSAPERTFSIAPTGVSFDYYVKGKKFTVTSTQSIVLPNLPGDHYIYFNDAGVLSTTQVASSDLYQNNALISIVYWNTDTNTHTYFAEERHGLVMDGATHTYLHTVFGARYLSGLALQNFTIGTGGANADAQFDADQGTIRDEDILIQIAAAPQIPILYRQGQQWRKKAADAFPMIYSGTAGYVGANGRLPYNQYTGGAWQLTQVQNNKYVLVHFFGTNDIENGIVGIQGITEYDSMEAARTGANAEISSLSGLPFAEFVAIGTVLLQTSNTFTNTPKADVVPVDGADYVDFRGTQLYTPAGNATTHSLLSGLAADDHFQYLLADGARAMSGALNMGTHQINNVVDPTSAQDAATKNYVDTEDLTFLKLDGSRPMEDHLLMGTAGSGNPYSVVFNSFNLIGLDAEFIFDLNGSLLASDLQALNSDPIGHNFFALTPLGWISYGVSGTNQIQGLIADATTYLGQTVQVWSIVNSAVPQVNPSAHPSAQHIFNFTIDLSPTVTPVLNATPSGSFQIKLLADPTDPQDAATKNYVDAEVTAAVTGTTSYFAGFDSTTGLLTEVPGYTFDDNGTLQIGAQNSLTVPAGLTDYISIGISPTIANPGLTNLSGVQLNSPIDQTVTNYEAFQVFGYGTDKPDNFTAYRSQTNYTGVGTNITHFTASGGSDCSGFVKAFEFNSSGDADTIQGVTLNPSGDATTIEGVSFVPSGSYTDASGIKVDLSSATVTNRPIGLDITQGTLNSTVSFTTVPNVPTIVDSGNVIRPIFEVQSGSPITNSDVLMTNLAGFMDFKDDYTSTSVGMFPLDLGVASVGFVSQVAVDAAKTADNVSMSLAGLAIDASSNGGTITDAHLYRGSAFTFGGSLTIDNLYGLKIENTLSDKATNTWGVSVEDAGAENYFAKSLVVGGATKKVSDDDIALEIGSKKVLKFAQLTAAERQALSFTLASGNGCVLYDTDYSNLFVYNQQWNSIATAGAQDIGYRVESVGDNISTPTYLNGSGLVESRISAFDVQLYISKSGASANYTLRAIKKSPGNWELSQEYVGDDVGIEFTIVSNAPMIDDVGLYYTTTNTGAVGDVRYKITTV